MEKTNAKLELAKLAKIIGADKATASVNAYLQTVLLGVFGGLTALGKDAFAKEDFIKGIGAALKQNKLASKFKGQIFDFMKYEGGIVKGEDGHWRADDNKRLVEACKKAKTEALTGYVSQEKVKEKEKEKAEKAKEDAAMSAEEYLLHVLEEAKAEAVKKSNLKDSAAASRWQARAALLEAVIKNRTAK